MERIKEISLPYALMELMYDVESRYHDVLIQKAIRAKQDRKSK